MPKARKKGITRSSAKARRAYVKLARGVEARERKVRIEFVAPESFKLPDVPRGVTVVHAGPRGEEKRNPPPSPDPVVVGAADPVVVSFRDARHLAMPSGLRRAEKAAAKAARTNRIAVVSIERSKGLSPETFSYVEAVGRSAGLKEISLRVGFSD